MGLWAHPVGDAPLQGMSGQGDCRNITLAAVATVMLTDFDTNSIHANAPAFLDIKSEIGHKKPATTNP